MLLVIIPHGYTLLRPTHVTNDIDMIFIRRKHHVVLMHDFIAPQYVLFAGYFLGYRTLQPFDLEEQLIMPCISE